MEGKSIIGYGTYFHNSDVWGAAVERIIMELLTETRLGDIDTIKVRSFMTMFDFLSPNDIFGEVLDSFYKSERCKLTLRVMQHG